MNWFNLSIKETVERLNTSIENGLSPSQVKLLQEKYGYNKLTEPPKTPPILMLLGQFANFLIIVLVIAAVISTFIGEYVESLAIILIVILAGVLGFIQEYKAQKAIEALKKMAQPVTTVIRDALEQEIPTRDLVPGDIVLVKAGDRVPADMRIIEAYNLKVDESPLTGESRGVTKNTEIIDDTRVPLGDRKNMLFMGTTVHYGRGKAVVVATGMLTEFGKIAKMLSEIEEGKTPLQISIDKTAKILGIFAIIISILVGVLGILRGETPIKMFVWAVALAVAIIPEALPAVLTVALAISVRRMAQKNALIRKLQAVETLGATSVICSDKTGTLTEDKMTVRLIRLRNADFEITGTGYSPAGEIKSLNNDNNRYENELNKLITTSILCNDARLIFSEGDWRIKGDPTEGALLVMARKYGLDEEEIRRQNPRISEIPFSSETKMMTTICRSLQSEIIAYSKGAVEVILSKCKYLCNSKTYQEITDDDRTTIIKKAESMAEDALRVLAFAYKTLPADTGDLLSAANSEMIFLGMVGIMDPPREGVKEAIDVCKSAGITTVMITGDHKITATAIAKEIGILSHSKKILTGVELDRISDEDFEKMIDDVAVYARVSPEHKLKIVNAFSKKGKIVAMTGDGVNDAPALKKADIGIAMGITGTEVSKEVSDMILTDDNFVSIVNAVKEGRTIFLNIRKFLTYLLTDNFGATLAYTSAILFGLPIPISALQILFINLIMDGPKAISLGLEPPEPDIMKHSPRNPHAGIFDKHSICYIFFVGLWISITINLVYIWACGVNYPSGNYAQTLFFVTLILTRTTNAFNCRSARLSIFKLGLFSNKWLVISFLGTIISVLLILYNPFLRRVFNVYPLSFSDWTIAILVSFSIIVVVELQKAIFRR